MRGEQTPLGVLDGTRHGGCGGISEALVPARSVAGWVGYGRVSSTEIACGAYGGDGGERYEGIPFTILGSGVRQYRWLVGYAMSNGRWDCR